MRIGKEEKMKELYGYMRQAEHCYLRREKEADTSFEWTMLLQNPLPELLPCRQQQVNDQTYLLYDVTSCKVLGDLWTGRGLRKEEIRTFVREVIHVLRECDRHLLDREKVVLKPELIFCDMDVKKYYFVYDPFLNPTENENLLSLAQYLVEQADYNQQRAVDLAYRIYEGVSGPNFTLRTLEQCLEDPEETQEILPESGIEAPDMQTEENLQLETESWNPEEGEALSGRFLVQKGALVVSLVSLLLCVWILYQYELSGKEQLALAGIMILAVMTAVCALLSWLHGGRKEEGTGGRTVKHSQVWEPMNREQETESEKTVYLAQGELLTQRGLQGMGQEWQRWISLGNLPLVIGKKSEFADYVLEDETISRMHARFVREEDHMLIIDLHSTNGTYVNGVRLEPDRKVEIHVGDRIGLGKLNFTYC